MCRLCIEILDDESIARRETASEVKSVDISEIQRTADAQDEEFLELAQAVIEPLDALRNHCQRTGPHAVTEPILRTILFLKTKQLGKHNAELLPLLAEAREYYYRRSENAAAAEVLAWSIAIMDSVSDLTVPDNSLLDLVSLYVKLNRQSEAQALLERLRKPE